LSNIYGTGYRVYFRGARGLSPPPPLGVGVYSYEIKIGEITKSVLICEKDKTG